MLLQVLIHTPKWVFAVFALLLWLGGKQLLAGSVSLSRTTLVPLAMVAFSAFGVSSAFGTAPLPLAGWAAATLVLLALVLSRPLPLTTRYDAATRSFQIAGSAVPLVLMMGIFLAKYVVGVTLAMHPELAHQPTFALGVSTLYGAFSGIFAARALRLWKLALRSNGALGSASLA